MQVVGDEAEPALTLVQLLEGHVGHQQSTQHKEGVHGRQRVHYCAEGKTQSACLNIHDLPGIADAEVVGHKEEAVAKKNPGHADEANSIEHIQIVCPCGLLCGHDGNEVCVEREGKAHLEGQGWRLWGESGLAGLVDLEDALANVNQGAQSQEDAQDGKGHYKG